MTNSEKTKPIDIVVFGGSGDLSLRKLMPSFYLLFRDGNIPEGSRILAISRGEFARDAFQDTVCEKLQQFIADDLYEQDVWDQFKELLDYMSLDLSNPDAWQALVDHLSPSKKRDLMFYMSVPPTLFAPICVNLKASGLNRKNARLVVEKPLGENAQTAEDVNEVLSSAFKEKQIYRIDHYLGKEAVQNLLALRFSNRLIQAIWNRDNIDYVEITVAETVGVEGRAEFLDRAGIVRDMIQNHLMQILCCLTMDTPFSLDANDIRDEKVRIVKALLPITKENIAHHVIRAQYGPGTNGGQSVPGYLEEIKKSDKEIAGTGETFVAIKAMIDNERWHGVPFYLRTGKRLKSRYAEIVVHFKPSLRNLYNIEENNKFIIELQPDMHISLDMFMKQLMNDETDLVSHRQSSNLVQTNGDEAGIRIPEAYEKLLLDVINADQTYFVRHDEIMASWKWIDGLRAAWGEADLPMHEYASGTMGPEAINEILEKPNHAWRDGKDDL